MKKNGLAKALVITAVFLILAASVSFLVLASNANQAKEELLPSASPTPTFMPAQTSTVAPSPTATLYPSTPTQASPTPSASSSPANTQTPTPSSNPVPTSIPTPTASPTTTSTPVPTSAPDSAYIESLDGQGAWMPVGVFYVRSPANQTYNANSLILNVSGAALVYSPSISYSLDGGPRLPITVELKASDPPFHGTPITFPPITFQQSFIGSAVLPQLANGSHVIIVYGDLASRLSKYTIYFEVALP
jgi:hypothetical protein